MSSIRSEFTAVAVKALEIDPNYVNAWDGIGWSLNELGDYSQAIIYLDKALEIDPNHIDALVFKSQALSNLEIKLERKIIPTRHLK